MSVLDTGIPAHVGIIPDGSRRWAAQQGVSLEHAYNHAFTRVGALLEQLWACGVEAVSVYMLSRKNLGRRPSELAAVYTAEARICATAFSDAASAHNASVTLVGDLSLVPAAYREALESLESDTRGGTRRLYLLVAYDPMAEMIRAMSQTPSPSADPLRAFAVPEPLDLIVRTSGVRSLSDFLPLQAAYAEIYFSDPLINEFTSRHLDEVLGLYAQAERRRGK